MSVAVPTVDRALPPNLFLINDHRNIQVLDFVNIGHANLCKPIAKEARLRLIDLALSLCTNGLKHKRRLTGT